MTRHLYCAGCRCFTDHAPAECGPRCFSCATCGTVRTAAGAILYGIEATP